MANKAMSRALKSRQVGLKKLYISVDGTATTPEASGLDATFVESVTDNGTGSYTITFKLPAQSNLVADGVTSLTANASANVPAVTKQSITVDFTDEDGNDVDADFNLGVVFPELKYIF